MLWDTNFMLSAGRPIADLLHLVQLVLEGDNEQGAFTRAENAKQSGKIQPRKWSPKNADHFSQLGQAFGENLAREALFRCSDNMSHAQNYCEAMSHPERRYKRTPIPPAELEAPQRALASLAAPRVAGPTNGTQQENPESTSSTSPPTPAAAESSAMAVDEPGSNGDGDHAASTPTSRRNDDLFESLSRPTPDLHLAPLSARDDLRKKQEETSPTRSPPTKDDLDDRRLALRESVINHCLEILHYVNDDSITFELRDLVNAACKSSTFAGRDSIASTVLASLMSLHKTTEELETSDEEAHRRRFEHIALYAHFLALILKNDQLFVTRPREANFARSFQRCYPS